MILVVSVQWENSPSLKSKNYGAEGKLKDIIFQAKLYWR